MVAGFELGEQSPSGSLRFGQQFRPGPLSPLVNVGNSFDEGQLVRRFVGCLAQHAANGEIENGGHLDAVGMRLGEGHAPLWHWHADAVPRTGAVGGSWVTQRPVRPPGRPRGPPLYRC